jgi:hypothetical protein
MANASLSRKFKRPSLMVFSELEPIQQSWAIASIASSDSGAKVEYTTSLPHDFIVGDEVQVSGATVSGFNITTPKIITNVATNTFKVASTATGTTSTAMAYGTKWDFGAGDVLYLTDDNREPLQITPQRIEFKRRMIDGTMRSHYVADKDEYSTSWSNIPSRKTNGSVQITSDNFGAGNDIKNWYEENTGDFWVLLVYDTNSLNNVSISAEKVNVFFDSFNFTVSTRGELNDLWDVSISLVEV